MTMVYLKGIYMPFFLQPKSRHKKRAVNLGFISKLASPFPLVYLYLNNIIYGFVSVRYGIRKDILLGEIWHKEGKTKNNFRGNETHLCDNVGLGSVELFIVRLLLCCFYRGQ